MIKAYIKVNNGDVDTVFQRINSAMIKQISEINDVITVSQDKVYQPVRNLSMFERVVKKISTYALQIVLEQYQKAERSVQEPDVAESALKPCRNLLSVIMGLPCAHKIRDMILNRRLLVKSDFE